MRRTGKEIHMEDEERVEVEGSGVSESPPSEEGGREE
jgi:hypothetical protein